MGATIEAAARAHGLDPTRVTGANATPALFGGAMAPRARAVVTCASTAEVQDSVPTAQELPLPLSVFSGGDEGAGRAVRADRLGVVASAMEDVEMDPAADPARIAGGIRTDALARALAPSGLVPVTGSVGLVRMLGLTRVGVGPRPDLAHLAVAPVRRLGEPILDHIGPRAWHVELAAAAATYVPGHQMRIRTGNVPGLTPRVVDGLMEAAATLTSPLSAVLTHPLHGAATRVPATASGDRRPHQMIELIASCGPGDEAGSGDAARVDHALAALSPDLLSGGYSNLFGPDDAARVDDAYGTNEIRLRTIKDRVDPDGISTAMPLPHWSNLAGPRS